MERVTLKKNKGEIIPTDLVMRLAEKFPAAAGAMCVVPAADGKGNVIQNVGNAKCITEADLDKLQETFFEDDLILSLANESGPDDIQPFKLVFDAEKQVIVTAFIEGEYPDWSEGDEHSDAYYLVHNFLHKKLNLMYKMSKGSLDNFTERLKSKEFFEEISALTEKRGHIVLATITGEIIEFALNNPDFKEFSWGWMSHPHGYVEEKTGAVAAVTAAATGLGDMVRGSVQRVKRQMGGNPATPAEAEKPFVPTQTLIKAAEKPPSPGKDSPPKTDTKIPDPAEPVKVGRLVKADPKHQTSRKKVKAYYNYQAGFLPDNYMEYPEVRSTKFFDLKSIDMGAKEVAKPAAEEIQLAATPRKLNAPAPAKDTTVHNKDIEVKARPLPVDKVNQIMELSTKKKVEEFLKTGMIKKTLDKSSVHVFGPEQVNMVETKQPSFAKQMGIDYEATLFWPYEALSDLGKEVPHALAVIAANHQVTVVKLKAQIAAMQKVRTEEHKDTHILAHEELAPTNTKAERVRRQMGGRVAM